MAEYSNVARGHDCEYCQRFRDGVEDEAKDTSGIEKEILIPGNTGGYLLGVDEMTDLQSAVCQIQFPKSSGTGTFVSISYSTDQRPKYFILTNWHVLPNVNDVEEAELWFQYLRYQKDKLGDARFWICEPIGRVCGNQNGLARLTCEKCSSPRPGDLDPKTGNYKQGFVFPLLMKPGKDSFITSEDLDFTLVELDTDIVKNIESEDIKPVRLRRLAKHEEETHKPAVGTAVWLVGHPQGGPRMYAHHHITSLKSYLAGYQMNTQAGSSGSPVFINNKLTIIHHQGYKDKENQGTLVSFIMDFLDTGKLPLNCTKRKRLEECDTYARILSKIKSFFKRTRNYEAAHYVEEKHKHVVKEIFIIKESLKLSEDEEQEMDDPEQELRELEKQIQEYRDKKMFNLAQILSEPKKKLEVQIQQRKEEARLRKEEEERQRKEQERLQSEEEEKQRIQLDEERTRLAEERRKEEEAKEKERGRKEQEPRKQDLLDREKKQLESLTQTLSVLESELKVAADAKEYLVAAKKQQEVAEMKYDVVRQEVKICDIKIQRLTQFQQTLRAAGQYKEALECGDKMEHEKQYKKKCQLEITFLELNELQHSIEWKKLIQRLKDKHIRHNEALLHRKKEEISATHVDLEFFRELVKCNAITLNISHNV